MSPNLRALLYLLAAAAFVVGLRRLSSPRTARGGNAIAAAGMLVAVLVTLIDSDVSWWAIGAGVALGALVGAVAALRVKMTAMPQMVAVFNGLGGLASALVAGAEYLRSDASALPTETMVSIIVSVLIGSVAFTGSLVAFAKLQDIMRGAPITYPGQRAVNLAVALLALGLGTWAGITHDPLAFWVGGAVALTLGILVVIPIGGADMPVVITLLNSLSGLAAAATGFVIDNSALIIAGALVGASGIILTNLMCRAMNRSWAGVLFGAFGGTAAAAGPASGSARAANPDDVAIALAYSSQVLIVPGYGLAVAQAQHALRALSADLEKRGVRVAYGIHPVAGRMPGHMNVLLAEVDVPYRQLLDLEDSNALMARTDVVLVVGANDVVNPSARDDPGSAIYGMPIIEADRARSTVIIKRSLAPGFAGIDNPLFYKEGTSMLFADARQALTDLAASLAAV
ncbi:MAG TPA: NAD(P)(+) transhydrogenase (Re/Si-specific) subunit beta [Acidimicrobiia bacterium]|nr:NAD(P)(+) transhydrogenase (Re/Si-specific) subunit beta [Acidimicrobiia bacterium]